MVKVKTTTNKRQCVDNAWAEEGGKQEERGEGARAIEMAQTDGQTRHNASGRAAQGHFR